MEWKNLTTVDQLAQIKEDSKQHPIVIYKHSLTCGISSVALNRLERAWKPKELQPVDTYYLDILRHRDVSQSVAQSFDVRHESPQLLLISQGKCVYHTSHMGISYTALKHQLSEMSDSSI